MSRRRLTSAWKFLFSCAMALPAGLIGLAQRYASRGPDARGPRSFRRGGAQGRGGVPREGRVGETMSYVHKGLLPGERVIYETGLHWLIYGRAILVLAIALLLAIGSTYAPSD